MKKAKETSPPPLLGAPPSLINLPVVPSKITRSSSTALAGPTTSPVPAPHPVQLPTVNAPGIETAPAALIVADDVATARFLAGEISFGAIPTLLSAAVERFGGLPEAGDLATLSSLQLDVRNFAETWRPA